MEDEKNDTIPLRPPSPSRRTEAGQSDAAGAAAVVVGDSLVADAASTSTAHCSSEISRVKPAADFDEDVDETKETVNFSYDFPKYVDCQETLIELAFFKWLTGFRNECRRFSSQKNNDLFYGIINFFNTNILPEIIDSRHKVNKSSLLKGYVEQVLLFFHTYHKSIKTSEALNALYYDKMSSLMAYYTDLSLMASKRYTGDKLMYKKISSKINSSLSVLLDDRIDYMFDSLFQLYYMFCANNDVSTETIILLTFQKLLAERPIPKNIKFLTYLRYIICFKLWKNTIQASTLDSLTKKKEMKQIRLLIRKLNPPGDLLTKRENFNWSKWPKLAISISDSIEAIKTYLKNVTCILYTENISFKACIQSILDASREDIAATIKLIEKQCLILRPDLFGVKGNEKLNSWSLNFDMVLQPLIPQARSCNSMLISLKDLKLFSDKNDLENPISSMLQKIKNKTHTSVEFEENVEDVSIKNEPRIEKPDDMNLLNSKVIDENKQDKNEPTAEIKVKMVDAVIVNRESSPVNVKQSNEDEMQVNTKQLKSSEKNVVLDQSDAHQTSSAGCSYTLSKEPKRALSTYSSESETCAKITTSKFQHKNNLKLGNQNQIIDFDCKKKPKFEHNNRVTLKNINDLTYEHSQNSLDSSVGASLVGDNNRQRKITSTEFNVASALLNLNCSQTFVDSDKDRNTKKCIPEGIELHRDQDGMISQQSVIQLSHRDPGSPECIPAVNKYEQMEVDSQSANIEGINSPMSEQFLPIRQSENIVLESVYSKHCVNENQHAQMYALPVDQQTLAHLRHLYVENTTNSNIRNLEVENILPSVLINSTNVALNNRTWAPYMSLIHANNGHNNVDVNSDHYYSSIQQQNGLFNSINPSGICNYNSGVNNFYNLKLQYPMMMAYNWTEPRIYSDNFVNSSPNGRSVSNFVCGSMYGMSQIIPPVPLYAIPSPVASTDVHELNYSSYNNFHENILNSTGERQSFNFAMNTTRQLESSSVEENHIDVVSDTFSDEDPMDLRIETKFNQTDSF